MRSSASENIHATPHLLVLGSSIQVRYQQDFPHVPRSASKLGSRSVHASMIVITDSLPNRSISVLLFFNPTGCATRCTYQRRTSRSRFVDKCISGKAAPSHHCHQISAVNNLASEADSCKAVISLRNPRADPPNCCPRTCKRNCTCAPTAPPSPTANGCVSWA